MLDRCRELGVEAEGVDLDGDQIVEILKGIDRDDLASGIEEYLASGQDAERRTHSSEAGEWEDEFRVAVSRHV